MHSRSQPSLCFRLALLSHCAPRPCRSYLQRKGALVAAAACGLRPRGSPHRIVPPRFFVPLDAPQVG